MQGTKREFSGKVKCSNLSLEEQALLTTIPLWRIPYEDQIRQKTQTTRNYLMRLSELILTRNPNLGGWIQRQQDQNKGFLCRVDSMMRTSSPSGYRAKCNFRVGFDPVTNERVVGFKGVKTGVLSVRPGDKMIQLPHQLKLVVKLFEDYVRQSPLAPFIPESKTGFWHHLSVRVSMAGEVMILVVMYPGNLTPQQLQYVKGDLTNYFFHGEGRVANVHCLYYHPFEEKNQEVAPASLELLGGLQRIVEPVMGVNFHLGPFTAFLTNTCTAQSFYQAIVDLVQPGPNVTIVDICAGIGSIGLTLAKKCKEVYAIEMLEEHITDGVLTAQMNNITNFSFLHGRAEDQLGDLLKSLEGRNKEIVCIFDPPRLGVNTRSTLTDLAFKIVDHVRKSDSVKRFVYICNNHKSPVRLFLDFCASPQERGSSTFTGSPFVPVRIIPFDLAPHTPHSQLFILFERMCSLVYEDKLLGRQLTESEECHGFEDVDDVLCVEIIGRNIKTEPGEVPSFNFTVPKCEINVDEMYYLLEEILPRGDWLVTKLINQGVIITYLKMITSMKLKTQLDVVIGFDGAISVHLLGKQIPRPHSVYDGLITNGNITINNLLQFIMRIPEFVLCPGCNVFECDDTQILAYDCITMYHHKPCQLLVSSSDNIRHCCDNISSIKSKHDRKRKQQLHNIMFPLKMKEGKWLSCFRTNMRVLLNLTPKSTELQFINRFWEDIVTLFSFNLDLCSFRRENLTVLFERWVNVKILYKRWSQIFSVENLKMLNESPDHPSVVLVDDLADEVDLEKIVISLSKCAGKIKCLRSNLAKASDTFRQLNDWSVARMNKIPFELVNIDVRQ